MTTTDTTATQMSPAHGEPRSAARHSHPEKPAHHGSGLVVDHVDAAYGSTQVLDRVCASFARGGVTSIIGPNGAGKSTLLGVMSRLQHPTAGYVYLDGADIHRANSRTIARTLGVMRQDNSVAIRLTVAELVGFGRYPRDRGRRTAAATRAINDALDAMELHELRDRYLDELSGGQRQRAFIAMVLAQDTDYVLLDEPLNNLDLKHATGIMTQMREAAVEMGRSVVMVIHDVNVAAAYSDRIVCMKHGRIIADGSPEQIMTPAILGELYDMPMRVAECEGRRIALYF